MVYISKVYLEAFQYPFQLSINTVLDSYEQRESLKGCIEGGNSSDKLVFSLTVGALVALYMYYHFIHCCERGKV